ncbi:hypothetical protein BN946_scf184455.g7 [Trametes cinnabarina]|uniref:Uncharacterized protein n=1 Tax=Pycnoporus cinnabarinus TaxID=5643 RepID=A0A060SR74_PYCCI|nr:hypothetical protein BN946_scf184455.g7 [Trametes cinnabarina]
MTVRHYARDAIQNPLNGIHQRCTWPFQCAICSGSANSLKMYFAPTVDSDLHYICAMRLDPPEPLIDDMELDCVPIAFTVIGQIAEEDCFLTSAGEPLAGRAARDHIHDRPVASCWFESRPDRDSCLEWRKLTSAIERVTACAVGPVNTSRVIRRMPNDSAVQLRVRFSPYEGEGCELPNSRRQAVLTFGPS